MTFFDVFFVTAFFFIFRILECKKQVISLVFFSLSIFILNLFCWAFLSSYIYYVRTYLPEIQCRQNVILENGGYVFILVDFLLLIVILISSLSCNFYNNAHKKHREPVLNQGSIYQSNELSGNRFLKVVNETSGKSIPFGVIINASSISKEGYP